MRYVLIDRITALVPGQSLAAIKHVGHGDDLVTRYAAGLSALPGAMLLEAMAQAAGLLVAATIVTPTQPVLAKVQPFTAYGDARPGDSVAIRVELEEIRSEGCRARVAASIDDRPLADATIYLALVPLEEGSADSRASVLRAALADTFPEWFS
jgi:3-hydroxymyristoyl/3-hydroxydecanoyl-(acyl carrier protein) dehydratase